MAGTCRFYRIPLENVWKNRVFVECFPALFPLQVQRIDVVYEERAGKIVETDEVIDGGMTGIGRVEVSRFVVGVAPSEDVCHGKVGDSGRKSLGPPLFIRKSFKSGLGKRRHFAVFLGKIADVCELPAHVFGVLCNAFGVVPAKAVAVESEDVDEVVAGLALHIRLGGVGTVGGIGEKRVGDTAFTEAFGGDFPKFDVLLWRTEVLSPPEP